MKPTRALLAAALASATATALFAPPMAAASSQSPGTAASSPASTSAVAPGSAVTRRPEAERAATAALVATASQTSEFHRVSTSTGLSGTTYVAYEQTYRDLPVIGGDLVVAVDGQGLVTNDPQADIESVAPATLRPGISAARATTAARRLVASVQKSSTPELVVFSPDGERKLAYRTVVSGRQGSRPTELTVIVDASNARIIGSWDMVMDGTGDGYYYSPVTFDTKKNGAGGELQDSTRGGLTCGVEGNGPVTSPNDSYGNGSGTDLKTACVDAYYAAGQEYDMLRNWLGRNGFDGKGKSFPLFVGLKDVNSYWNGHTANFGKSKDGKRQLTSLDLVGHELGHAIFQFTPGGFDGYAETYQLNESNGDIFGALTEHYANNPSDPPDFVFAEEDDPFNRGAERIMYEPSIAPRKGQPDCWSTNMPNVEVHDGAGPSNHAFYLLSEGSNPGGGKPASPICSGGPASVTGIGIQAAGQVWMEALMLKTTFWTYADARKAVLRATTNLFPGDCAKFDAAKGAWDGIAVPAQSGEAQRPSTCGSVPDGDFSVGVTPSSAEVEPGASASATLSTSVTSGKAQSLALTAEGAPAGVTVSFSPDKVTAGQSSTVSVATATITKPGTYAITLRATGSKVARTAPFALTVKAGPGDPDSDFSVSVSPSSATVEAGTSASASLSTSVTSGKAQSLALTAEGAPSGATVTFAPTKVTAGQSSTVSIATAKSTPAGTYAITLRATGDKATRTASYSLTVTAPPGDTGCSNRDVTVTKDLSAHQLLVLPSWSGFAAVAGEHSACLVTPAGAKVEVQLQQRQGSSWNTVGTMSSPSKMSLTYQGAAGSYRYLVVSGTAAKGTVIGYDTP